MQGLGTGAISLFGPTSRSSAGCRVARRQAIAAFALSEPEAAPTSPHGMTARARRRRATSSTARRPGSPTAASPTSMWCSPAPARRRAPGASRPSSSTPARPGSRSPSASRSSRRTRWRGCASTTAACRCATASASRARASGSPWRRSTCSAPRSAPRRWASPGARSTKRSRVPRARAVRRAAGRLQIDAGQARRHGARHRCRRAARLPRRLDEGHRARARDRARRRWPSCTPPNARRGHRRGGAAPRRRSACDSGPKVERLYREIRALRIYEGATEGAAADHRARAAQGSCEILTSAARRVTMPPTSTPSRATTCRRATQWPELMLRPAGAAVSRAAQLRRPSCSTAGGARARRPRACATDGRAGPTTSLQRRPTASPTCWCDEMGSCPATACCCAAPNNPMMAPCWLGGAQGRRRRGRHHAAAARAGARQIVDKAGSPGAVRPPARRGAATAAQARARLRVMVNGAASRRTWRRDATRRPTRFAAVRHARPTTSA